MQLCIHFILSLWLKLGSIIFTQCLWYLWRRQWHPTPVLLPGKSHGWRSLVGCSPWGREESDMTEGLHFHFSLFTFMHWRRKWQPTPVFLPGESQGQRSLVAAVYGVAENRTRLKWLSSSSSSMIFIKVIYELTGITYKLHFSTTLSYSVIRYGLLLSTFWC